MARQEIVLGTPPTGLGGDPPRVASMKINAMMLELYGAAGIGGIAAKMDKTSALIADPNNATGGFIFTAVGNAANPTELNVGFAIFTIPGSATNNGAQIAWPLTSVTANKNRVWTRQCFNNVWSPWTESLSVTSLAALFGIGGTSLPVTDLDVLFGTNVYRVLGTATGTPVNQAGMVQHMQYGTTVGSASAQVYVTYEATPRMFYRSRPTNGVYTAWIPSASMADVDARLAFYGIGLAAADQAQATSNLNTATVPNRYRVAANATGKPGALGGTLEVIKGFANTIVQWFTESGTSSLWVRSTTDTGTTWSVWDKKASQADVDASISALQTSVSAKANSGANSDIKSLSGLTTALSVSQGGTGGNNQATARAGLGLGTAAVAAIGVGVGDIPDARRLGFAETLTTNIGWFDDGSQGISTNLFGPGSPNIPSGGTGYYYKQTLRYGTGGNRLHIAWPYGTGASGTIKFQSVFNGTPTPIQEIYHTGNTTRGSGGVLSAASPILRIACVNASTRLDLQEQTFTPAGDWGVANSEALGVSVERTGVGEYKVIGRLGLALEGWRTQAPCSPDGGGALGITDSQQDENGTITISLFKQRWTLTDDGEMVPGRGAPMDVPLNSWIDVRLEMPVVEVPPTDFVTQE